MKKVYDTNTTEIGKSFAAPVDLSPEKGVIYMDVTRGSYPERSGNAGSKHKKQKAPEKMTRKELLSHVKALADELRIAKDDANEYWAMFREKERDLRTVHDTYSRVISQLGGHRD